MFGSVRFVLRVQLPCLPRVLLLFLSRRAAVLGQPFYSRNPAGFRGMLL